MPGKFDFLQLAISLQSPSFSRFPFLWTSLYLALAIGPTLHSKMAQETRCEVIRTQATEYEHNSLSSTDENEKQSGVEPQTLPWWQVSKAAGVMMDVIAITLSCLFFAYALAVRAHQGMPMDGAHVQLLRKSSNLVSILHLNT